jgi:multifunctional methyltransferase subunit TRM112
MRLLTHNTLKNNSAAAKGKGFPLRITASEVKVHEISGSNEALMMDDERQVAFVKGVLSMLDWPALVQVRVIDILGFFYWFLFCSHFWFIKTTTMMTTLCIFWWHFLQAAKDLGIPTLPPILTQELAEDEQFLKALYHVLMNVHLIQGMLTCPVTGREFPVMDGIPNMMIQEDECEAVRY